MSRRYCGEIGAPVSTKELRRDGGEIGADVVIAGSIRRIENNMVIDCSIDETVRVVKKRFI